MSASLLTLRRGLVATVALLVLLVLLMPSLARASAYTQVEQTYVRTDTIPLCTFSTQTLAAALKETPTFEVEYFGDFTSAIQSAMSEQATGRCSHHAITGAAPLGPALSGPALPRSITTATGGGIPLPLLLALILAVLAGGVGAVLAAVRLGGWEPGWLDAGRHAWGEAEFRISGSWSDLRDRLRA